jgi:hypothetical protein
VFGPLVFVGFHIWELFQKGWKRVNRFMLIVMQKGSLFRLLLRPYHVMLGIILIICLVVIVVA